MKKVLGALLVGLPFVAAFALIVIISGWLFAITIWGSALVMAAMIVGGISLLTS